MKFLFNTVLTLAILAGGAYVVRMLWLSPSNVMSIGDGAISAQGGMTRDAEEQRGPHGGRLLASGRLQLEITVYERGVPPEFRVYAYLDGEALPPGQVSLEMRLTRLGGATDAFRFEPREDYLVGTEPVREPHSFDVEVSALYGGDPYSWTFEQHEGRTRIPESTADAAGIETERAGPAEIREIVRLQGEVRADPGRIRQVRPRYAGVIRAASRRIGDRVDEGEVLARVESNDSLQTYELKAPLAGTIVAQHAAAGEAIDGQAIYTVANFDVVWIDLAVFPGDRERIAPGQPVLLKLLGGETGQSARIDYLLPVGDRHSRTTTARITLDNRRTAWQPGMAVIAEVTVRRQGVPLAVRNSALQTFRDFDVVYARYGEHYEVRMLDLGASDDTHTAVLGGLDPGTEYVVSNSYLLKADIEKSGAAHGH